MKIDTIRIYAEVLEQGIDFKEYIEKAGFTEKIVNVYTKKCRGEFMPNDSVIDRIRKVKDADILITSISDNKEYPLLMVEYSTAVPTDDHRMQRADVYYWGAMFRVPIMKISPSAKGMGQDFGGGGNITDIQEQFIAHSQEAIFYPIKWETKPNSDILLTKDNKLSCIPNNQKVSVFVSEILNTFINSSDYASFYSKLRVNYSKTYCRELRHTTIDTVKSSIKNSARFKWDEKKEKLCVKINRFGHAMDPDRGVLYFANMLVGVENTISEIQVNRPEEIDCRGGYKKLFDGLSNESSLILYVKDIIKNHKNVFSDENALYVLTHGLNIPNTLKIKSVGDHQYTIPDESLRKFLLTHSSIVSKTIFFLSTMLILTDVNREVICSIKWNTEPIIEYLSKVGVTNFTPISIKPLTNSNAKEDIITFASVELYKKIQCELLAVSYPGAQGDRCILTGKGRNVLRTYVDIIAYKHSSNGIEVFLEECKDAFFKSSKDVKKLNDIVGNQKKTEGLKLLFNKVIQNNNIKNINLSIAAKQSPNIPQQKVDYIFMFTISSENNHTYIDYTVAVVNTNLVTVFLPLSNNSRLTGRLTFDEIFIIDSPKTGPTIDQQKIDD